MQNGGKVTVRPHRDKVNPLTRKEIQHRMIDLEVDEGALAARISARGVQVGKPYVNLLLAAKRKGKKPHGRLVVAALAEELGVSLERLTSYLEGDDQNDKLSTMSVDAK